GGSNTHNITVPAGTSELRLMVYWADFEGAASAAPALVNNINMQVVDPALATFDPWVLNPASQNLIAVRGVDNLNNMEQVTIDNPSAGSYTINIDGATIPQGPQDYYVVYEFIQNEVVLTYPIGGEGLNPGSIETIRWDSYGNSGTFSVEYSENNGVTWNLISSSVSSTNRYLNWTVPNIVSGEALVRVTRDGLSSQSDDVFSIIRTPSGLNVDWACIDSIQLSWIPVTGATSYEVSQLGVKYMDSVGVTNTNSIVLHGINFAVTDWFSVRSLGANNIRGERAYAIEKIPGTFNCPIPTDVGLENLSLSNNGVYTSCSSSIASVSLVIKNEGIDPVSNVPVRYVLNGMPVVNEVYSGTLAPGNSINYVFQNQFSPIIGTNNLTVWTDMVGDGNYTNDSIVVQFNLINSVAKTIPWSDDFESFSICNTASNCEVEVCGLSGDFVNAANGTADDIDWRTDVGGTPTNGTGPSSDYNPGIFTGKYLYLESSSCFNKTANLISPCIDLINVSNPELVFAYHMSGISVGSLHVDILENGIWVNDIIPSLNGNQGVNWQTKTVSLSSYIGSIVNIRLRGISGVSFSSDIAIDDVKVTEVSTVNVEDLTNNIDFKISPNPSNGIYNYSFISGKGLDVSIYDVNGKVVYKEFVNEGLTEGVIDISKYNNGIYMLVLSDGMKRVTKRIIKR
ncbi:MAG: T9SS type A sorting domain-containing protein, partial [Vicingaceae bacterium]|nr:T9SS type A sorting domain-containing protein [Vicingaceae bacterium]